MTSNGLMSPTKMQDYNAYIVLKLIRDEGEISRADIARKLGSSKSAISNIIALLDEYGLVEEAGEGSPHTGRKSKLLKFNARACFFISADIRWKKTNIAIVDLDGNILDQTVTRNRSNEPSDLIELVVNNVSDLMKNCGITLDRIEGAGIMVPGIVDINRGVVLFSGPLGWNEPVSLASEIRKKIDIPVSIENDANAMGLGETWIGKGESYSNIVYLYTEGGIGGAFIHNREIFHGFDFTAAEFGKTLINSSGSIGRVESFLSIPGILEAYRPDISVSDLSYEDALDIVKDILDIEKNGWSDNIREIVDIFAQLASNLIMILNPEIMIIHSPYLTQSPAFLEELNVRIKSYLPDFPHRTVKIRKAHLTDTTEVLGGAAVALRNSRFNSILLQNR